MNKSFNFFKLNNRLVFPFVFSIYSIAAVFLGIVVALHFVFGISTPELTRDPVQILHGYIYNGFLSNIGMILWSGTAGVCFFIVLFNINEKEKKNEQYFFLFAFMLTILLLLDDMFMIHDIFLPQYLKTKENYMYFIYGSLSLVFFVKFRKLILITPYFILFSAIFFFGVSVSLDILDKYIWIPAEYFVEDSFKFLGIANWGGYFVLVGYLSAKGRLTT